MRNEWHTDFGQHKNCSSTSFTLPRLLRRLRELDVTSFWSKFSRCVLNWQFMNKVRALPTVYSIDSAFNRILQSRGCVSRGCRGAQHPRILRRSVLHPRNFTRIQTLFKQCTPIIKFPIKLCTPILKFLTHPLAYVLSTFWLKMAMWREKPEFFPIRTVLCQ